MSRTLIVGAGPAGLATAKAILQNEQHNKVTIVDTKRVIGKPQRCAGGVSSWMLEKAHMTVPTSAIQAQIRRFKIIAPDGESAEISGKAYGYVLDRTVFEQELAKEVEDLHGDILLESNITCEQLEDCRRSFDYIVGADGPSSVVRKWCGLPRLPDEDVHLGIQKTLEAKTFPRDTIEMHVGSDVAPHGYAWIFPVGEDQVRVGLGIPSTIGWQAEKLLNKFIKKKEWINSSPPASASMESVAKLIPTGRMPKSGVAAPNIFLTGDALPSTDPLTGGGIVQAIMAGTALGEAIAAENPAVLYDEKLRWLRKQNGKRYRLKKVLFSLNDRDLKDLVESLNSFTPKSMSVGTEIRRAVMHLLVRKPKMVKKVLGAYF